VTARRLVSAASLFLLSVLGCRPKVESSSPPIPLEPAVLERTVRELVNASEAIRRYQGFVRIRGKGPEGGFDARLVVIFERPSEFRVELLGPFGSTRWSAVATEDGIRVVFPGRKQFLKEEDTADIVGRLLGIRLHPEELMAILSGLGTPLRSGASDGYRRGSTTVLTTVDGGRLEIADDGQVRRVRTRNYRVSYPTPYKRHRRQVPDRLRLETDRLEVTLTPEDVDVNVALDTEAFFIEIPAGAVRLRPAEVDGEAVFVATGEGVPR